MRHAIESALGGDTACAEVTPDLLPAMRHVRDALRIADGSRELPSEALGSHQGPVAPGDPAASTHIDHPLDPRLAPKPCGEERHGDQVPHALTTQDGRLLIAWANGRITPDLPPPRCALQEYRAAHANTRHNHQPQTRLGTSPLAAADHRYR